MEVDGAIFRCISKTYSPAAVRSMRRSLCARPVSLGREHPHTIVPTPTRRDPPVIPWDGQPATGGAGSGPTGIVSQTCPCNFHFSGRSQSLVYNPFTRHWCRWRWQPSPSLSFLPGARTLALLRLARAPFCALLRLARGDVQAYPPLFSPFYLSGTLYAELQHCSLLWVHHWRLCGWRQPPLPGLNEAVPGAPPCARRCAAAR